MAVTLIRSAPAPPRAERGPHPGRGEPVTALGAGARARLAAFPLGTTHATARSGIMERVPPARRMLAVVLSGRTRDQVLDPIVAGIMVAMVDMPATRDVTVMGTVDRTVQKLASGVPVVPGSHPVPPATSPRHRRAVLAHLCSTSRRS